MSIAIKIIINAMAGFYNLPRQIIDFVQSGILPYGLLVLQQKALLTYIHTYMYIERIINPQLYQVGIGFVSSMSASPYPPTSVRKILDHVSVMKMLFYVYHRNHITQLFKWMAPTLSILGLILILAIAIPITGCWYSCSRRKGRCCADKYRRILPNHRAKFFTTLFLMLIFNAFLV